MIAAQRCKEGWKKKKKKKKNERTPQGVSGRNIIGIFDQSCTVMRQEEVLRAQPTYGQKDSTRTIPSAIELPGPNNKPFFA